MADAFEDEVEQTITIDEYIKGVEAQELEADLVLGGDEGEECTYIKGYMKRQAVFSCLTCTPAGNAGVCTACCLSCHDGHEVVELWTKRKFRCDCGNSKFGEFFCKRFAAKDPENTENSYNQNFKGSYCTCGRPYPDLDAEEQVEMIQCCICEDWFHENHLGLESGDEIPRDEEGEPLYEEFICQDCSIKLPFLLFYPPDIWARAKQAKGAPSNIKEQSHENVLSGSPVKVKSSLSSSDNPEISNDMEKSGISNADNDVSEKNCGKELSKSLGKLEKCEIGSSENPKVNISSKIVDSNEITADDNAKKENAGLKQENGCLDDNGLGPKCFVGVGLKTPFTERDKKPLFLLKNWRDILCRCVSCQNIYTEKGIRFLLDKEDSMEEYEKIGKQKREEKLQQQEGVEMNFLNNLGRVQQIEILSGIADMKNELHAFLGNLDPSKPVTSADVQQVFENLAKKRQRLQ
ncbi:hypothetical protein AMTRI_Chr01g134190 [Amborella trichopoda]